MFTVADIRDIAVQIERNGEKTYRQASRIATNAEIADLFSWMADEERRHGDWFEKHINSEVELTEEQLELEKMGRQLLQEMVADQTFSLDEKDLASVTSFQDMIVLSKGFEKDTILFYEFLKGIVGDRETEKQLEDIIAEEQKHYQRLEELEENGFGVAIPVA